MSSETEKLVQKYLHLAGMKSSSVENKYFKKSEELYNRLFAQIEKEERDFYRYRGMTESQMVDKVQKIIEDFLR